MEENAKKIVKQDNKNDEIVSSIVLRGDLSNLSPQDKVKYYREFCYSLDLNPLTMPFNLLRMNNKEVLYANKNCGEQLRKNNGVSVIEVSQQIIDGIMVVNVKVQDKNGRVDIETGAVNIAGLKGDMLANAIMKAVTKAKRRATLSICSVGVMDESEIETVPDVEKVSLPLPINGKSAKDEKSDIALQIKEMLDEMQVDKEERKSIHEIYKTDKQKALDEVAEMYNAFLDKQSAKEE